MSSIVFMLAISIFGKSLNSSIFTLSPRFTNKLNVLTFKENVDFFIFYSLYTISISCTVTFFSASTPNAFNTGFPGSIKDKIRYSAVES